MVHEEIVKTLAQDLIKLAVSNSKDKKIETPFSKNCKKRYNYKWEGGKPDDITVIVALIVKEIERDKSGIV